MRLADFIERDMTAIVCGWEAFAATQLPAAADMNSLALRDHIEPLLRAIVNDIGSPQNEEEREQKSKGRAARPMEARNTEAEIHALLRAQGGFTVNQLAAEYRALRASVLHLWTRACRPSAIDPRDVYRFNEAIDQAVAESLAHFSAHIENERNLFLGMLGHDMQVPLQVIQFTAIHLSGLDAGTDVATCAARLSRSARHLKAFLDDLVDFNRINLGLGITICTAGVDLAEAFAAQLEQLRVANPDRNIELEVSGDVTGVWDINHLNQLLGNLVVNALKYGAFTSPVKIVLSGLSGEVTFSVHNQGSKIEQSALAQIFKPLKRGLHQITGRDGGMGLGLYIAREIAIAHHGDISATSDENETVFKVRLPRSSDAGRP
jgi:signal transduction histidine kinase